MRPIPVSPGDIVKLKKGHPCGANEWEVVRIGIDIGLTCRGCGRGVRVERSKFNGRFKEYIKRIGDTD